MKDKGNFSKKSTIFFTLGVLLYAVMQLLDHIHAIILPDFISGFFTGLACGFILTGVFYLFVHRYKTHKRKLNPTEENHQKQTKSRIL